MTQIDQKKLLKDRRVIDEINRHLWIESEKVGYDISFEKASIDWLDRFSKAWMQYHMPNRKMTKNKPVKAKRKAAAKSSSRSKSRR